jgi:hypothetical protein
MSRVLSKPSDTPVLKVMIPGEAPGDAYLSLLADGKLRFGFIDGAVLESGDLDILAAGQEANQNALRGEELHAFVSNLIAKELAGDAGSASNDV